MGDKLTQKAPKTLEIVVPLNEDGSKRRGARYKTGENYMTGASQTRQSQEVYVHWLASPEGERSPRLKTQMAESLGVTLRTLNYWEKDPWVMKRVMQETKNAIRVTRVSSILDSLYTTAVDTESSRQVQAAKVLLDYTDRAVEEVSADELAEMEPSELAELLAEVHDMILAEEDEE